MLYPSERDWELWNIRSKSARFFALHWAELFDEDTPDTWQVRTCNVRALMQEIMLAAERASHHAGYRKALEDLTAEAEACARRDPVVKRCSPFVLSYLKSWARRQIGESDIAKLERVACVIDGNLQAYRQNACELLGVLIGEGDARKKSELYDAGVALATEISRAGYSTEHVLQTHREVLLSSDPADFTSRFSVMTNKLDGVEREYTCTFLPEGVRYALARTALPAGVRVAMGPPSLVHDGPEAEFYRQGYARDLYVSIIVRAIDPVMARHKAEQRLMEVFAALNVYGVRCRYRLKIPEALVRNTDGEVCAIISPSDSRLGHLRNSKGVHEKAARILAVHTRLSEGNAAQLMAAMQYHRLALHSTSDEARLVNLWIAAESLCQSGEGSIIDRVCAGIAPCVAIGNVRKILIGAAIYLRSFWRDRPAIASELIALFPGSDDRRLRIEDLLDVLLEADGARIQGLFRLTGEHPLLCYRLFRIRDRILKDPNSLCSNLRSHRQNVEWQLRRIYRARNELLHAGRSMPQLRQLTQHLHTYLTITIQALAHELQERRNWGIADALGHRRMLFDHMIELCNSGRAISRQALVDISRVMENQQEPLFAQARDAGGSEGRE